MPIVACYQGHKAFHHGSFVAGTGVGFVSVGAGTGTSGSSAALSALKYLFFDRRS